MSKPRWTNKLWARAITAMCAATRLTYCDKDCACGDNSELMFWPVAGHAPPAWLPDWMNGAGPGEVYDWLVKAAENNAEIHAALVAAGLPFAPAAEI